MTEPPATPQLAHWTGEFGVDYISRNGPDPDRLAALIAHWTAILRQTQAAPARSILEVGANIGLNLRVLAGLTSADLYALEPNGKARETLVRDQVVRPERIVGGVASAIELADGAVELAFTSGVLIHIHPRDLLASCREVHRVTSRYLVCVEYFADREEELPYRGLDQALFKRDFGGFYLDNFPDLRLLDYGFAWKRATGLDNLTWQLFEKG